MPSAELLASMGTYNEALAEAGIIQDGGGLRPTRFGARVRFDLDTGYGKSRIWMRQSVG